MKPSLSKRYARSPFGGALILAGLFAVLLAPAGASAQDTDPATAMEQRIEQLGIRRDMLPSEERIKKLESNPDDHPVYMLNLLKFKPNGGQAEYMQYGMAAQKRLAETGASMMFVGQALPGQDGSKPYDAIAIVEYPTRKGLRKLEESDDYRAALVHRDKGLDFQILYAMNGEMPASMSEGKRVMQEIKPAAPPASPQALTVVELLRFKPDGGEETYFKKYIPEVQPIFEAHGGRTLYAFKGEQVMLGDETYDYVLVLEYPNPAAALAMAASPEYQAIKHYRAEAVEWSQVLPCRNMTAMALAAGARPAGARTEDKATTETAEDSTAPATGEATARKRPNIVVILADDLGYNDLSIQGNTLVRTPNIDSIGINGVRFTRGNTSNATCSPSRAGLLTGRNQQRFGYEFVAAPHDFVHALDGSMTGVDDGNIIVDLPKEEQVPLADMGIPPSEITIAEQLKTAGYRTGAVGKWHVGSAPRFRPDKQGFDFFTGMLQGAGLFAKEDDPNVVNAKLEWDGIDKFLWSVLDNKVLRDGRPYTPEKYMTTFLGDEAIRFIDESKDGPFFLYLAFNAPHTPLQAPKDVYDRLSYIADHKTRVYYAMIESMDEAVGKVLAHLRELGIDDNTIVVFTSDNGAAPYTRIPLTNAPFRGAKATYYQGGVVVPFLMKWPGVIEPGQVRAEPISLLDIFPTVVDAAGARTADEPELDGVDLLPYLRGEKTGNPHEALVWRSGSYKAILYGDYRLQIDGMQKKTMLYNIRVDVGERNNLAERMPEKVGELKTLLEKAETHFVKPLWPTPAYGKVPADLWPTDMPADAEFIYFPV